MSRGIVLGVLLGAGGATAFWRMRLREPKQPGTPTPTVTAPAPLQTQPETVELAAQKVTQSAVPPDSAASSRAEPVEQTRAQPPAIVSPPAPAAGSTSLVNGATLAQQPGLLRSQTTTPSSSPPAATPRPVQDAKTAALVNKFMTKGVIPRLHQKIQDLFRVDEGLKNVRSAEQTKKPQLFVELGEACFAQLLVGLQAFCLLKLLIAVKLSYATRRGKPKVVDKKAGLDSVKQDVFAAVDKFLQQGLTSLVVRHACSQSAFYQRACGAETSRVPLLV
eukprot:COSAG02_NODE_1157_length_14186_cov_11.986299_6_plen_277_part_00